MSARPSETLMALIRAARMEGGAVADAPAAEALAAIGASAAEVSHLVALLCADNGWRFEADALRWPAWRANWISSRDPTICLPESHR